MLTLFSRLLTSMVRSDAYKMANGRVLPFFVYYTEETENEHKVLQGKLCVL